MIPVTASRQQVFLSFFLCPPPPYMRAVTFVSTFHRYTVPGPNRSISSAVDALTQLTSRKENHLAAVPDRAAQWCGALP